MATFLICLIWIDWVLVAIVWWFRVLFRPNFLSVVISKLLQYFVLFALGAVGWVKNICWVEFVLPTLFTYLIELLVIEFFDIFKGHWLVHNHIFYFLFFLCLRLGRSVSLLLFLDLSSEPLVVCCLRYLFLFFFQLLLLVSNCLVIFRVTQKVQGVLFFHVLADGQPSDWYLLERDHLANFLKLLLFLASKFFVHFSERLSVASIFIVLCLIFHLFPI